MAIIQISKIQQRTGNLIDLPQLDEAEFGWASDEKKLFIGKTTPNENIEILTSYSTVNFDAIAGSYGNLNINPNTVGNGQILTFNGVNWVNRGGNAGGIINLGDVANLKILGGGIGYILETDGTGNLSWTPKGTLIAFIENATPSKVPLNQTVATTSYASNGNILIANTSGYLQDTPIVFTGTGFGNISTNTLYYVNSVSSGDSTIKITDVLGGSAISLTDANGNLGLNIVGTIVTTVANNFFTQGTEITVTDAAGMVQLNGNTFFIDVITANTFALYTNPALTDPVYSNNYNSYAYTSVTATDSATSTITVGNSSEFTLNAPVMFKGDLGNSDLIDGETYYVNNIVSGTEIKVSSFLFPNGIAGNTFPVDTDLTIFNSIVFQQGGRIISSIGGSTSTQASGSNTTIQFNNNNILDGDPDFTFDFGTTPKLVTLNGNANVGNLVANGIVSGTQLISNIPTLSGPPLIVTSTLRVSNLNVNYANVSDFSNVVSETTGNTYLILANNSTSGNYQLRSNSNLSFNVSTGNLIASILTATGNINGNNLIISNQSTTGNLIVTGNLSSNNWAANGIAFRTTPQTYTDSNTPGNAILSSTHISALSASNIDTANGNVTISNAATLYIAGAPSNASTNLTITNTYALMINSGNVLIAGNANIGNILTNVANITTINSGLLQNGNSNVTIAANGNITLNANGGARIIATSTGANVSGTLAVSGNANTANLGTTNLFANNLSLSGTSNGNINVATIANSLGFRIIPSTYTDNLSAPSSNVNVAAIHAIGRPTVTASNTAITANNLATFYIENAPNASTNMAITSPWALYIANGNSFFGQGIMFGDGSGIGNVRTISFGTSNVRVYQNANVEVSINGISNLATFFSTGFKVAGTIETTNGNIQANGNIIANGNISGGNAFFTGNANAALVGTAQITSPTGNLTISASGSNQSIFLVPSGTGTVDVAGKRLSQIGSVINPNDATNKEYVDALSGTGLTIHSPANVAQTTNLAGSYTIGGTTPTVTTISGNNTITFNATHGLSVNDGIVFTNTFNGIVGGEGYWVSNIPSATQITIKNAFFGSEITTLTNATGLTQPARANPGVGATLTNSGPNAALVIDGITLSASQRVLLVGQTTGGQNGVYVVTNPGNVSAAWVLTRSSDMNKYIPGSASGIGAGDYLFVTQGLNNAGTSWVLSNPTGEIIIGTTAISFSQFSSAGAYTAGNGITITGTVITANTDGVTTSIVGGNIVVKTSANLTTPNIGAASGTSLTVSGNITANNLSIGNLANIGGNITTGGNLFANYNIQANGNITANNANITNICIANIFQGTFANGNSYISIPTAGGSIVMYVNGNSNVRLSTNTLGVNVNPTLTLEGGTTALGWGNAGIGFKVLAATYTANGYTGNSVQSENHIHAIAQPTIASSNSNVTIQNSSTFYIADRPAAGTNITIGNAYALYVAQGNSYFGGNLTTIGNITAGNFVGAGNGAPAITSNNTLTISASNALTIIGNSLALSNVNSISAGANTSNCTLTGNFILSAGSRLQATYADLAEFYESDFFYEPGTVLEFGGDKEVTIAKNETNKVAGVVTSNPAYIMNANCLGIAVAVALQGRVPVKVEGNIIKGDLMVSSGNGYAKASSSPIIGSVLGKALQNFKGAKGIIEIAIGRL